MPVTDPAGDVPDGARAAGRAEPAQETPRDEPARQTQICVGCGLCCDGTLFSHIAALDDGDLGLPLRSLGVELIYEADPPAFALPCPAVADGVCTIYDLHRPRACREFECDVCRGVVEGRLAVEDARAIIARTAAVRDEVRAGRADASELRRLVHAHFRSDAEG